MTRLDACAHRNGRFRKGRDKRRHRLSLAEKQKGGWITTWLYVHVSEVYEWTKWHRNIAREAYASSTPPR